MSVSPRPLNVVTAAELEELKCRQYAENTGKKIDWGCNAYNQWRETCIETNGPNTESCIVKSDLNKYNELTKRDLCDALCKFITQIRKYSNEDYPKNSLEELIISIQMFLKTKRIEWRLLNESDEIFVELYNITDNVMKQRRKKGMGLVKHSTPISTTLENDMWKKGILGEHAPKVLCQTVLYLIGVNFALFGASEHKQLRRPGFGPQIMYTTDTDGVPCLVYNEDACSKTNQGGLCNKYNEPRQVYCYESDDWQRCPVRLFRKYIGLLPKGGKHCELYMQSKKKPLPQLLVQ